MVARLLLSLKQSMIYREEVEASRHRYHLWCHEAHRHLASTRLHTLQRAKVGSEKDVEAVVNGVQ